MNKVVFISNWFDNPYKTLIMKHLALYDIEIEEYQWSILFIQNVLKNGRIDVLHLHTIHDFVVARNNLFVWIKFLVFISQLAVLKILRVKIVWTVHELADKIFDGKHDIPKANAIILGYFINAIITHCETTRQEVTSILNLRNKEKVFVVHHGNYIGVYKNACDKLKARETLNLSNESIVFLLFGGIYRSKGVIEAITSFKSLTQNQINLIIVGKLGERNIKEIILESIKGCEDIIFLPQQIADNEVQIYMNACDCTLLPYKIFTTSGVALLSMSYGRACIAPRSGFFKDILDDSGAFLYNPNEQDGLLNAMKAAIYKKNELEEMGKHNLEIAQSWNWDYVAKETYKVYQYCLEN